MSKVNTNRPVTRIIRGGYIYGSMSTQLRTYNLIYNGCSGGVHRHTSISYLSLVKIVVIEFSQSTITALVFEDALRSLAESLRKTSQCVLVLVRHVLGSMGDSYAPNKPPLVTTLTKISLFKIKKGGSSKFSRISPAYAPK